MSELTFSQRLDRVNARTAAIRPGRALAGLLLSPLLVLGFTAFWLWSGTVWGCGWVKNATVEGWDWARTHSPKAEDRRT